MLLCVYLVHVFVYMIAARTCAFVGVSTLAHRVEEKKQYMYLCACELHDVVC